MFQVFPRRDWQLVANQSANGGLNYFAIRDCGDSNPGGSSECGTRLFTIEGGADNDSIYVDSAGNQGGNVGFGTATPVVDLHVLSGNTPTLRLLAPRYALRTPVEEPATRYVCG